jgi:glutathione S-transferase
MRLYDNLISGNCYKVRLFLALIGKPYESIAIDSLHGETRQPRFLAISPRGLIPVLEDQEERIADSMAILIYLARRYAPEWLPEEPLVMARVMEWLAVAADELQYGAAQARRIKKLGTLGDLTGAQMHAERGLSLLERQLEETTWLSGDRPTIADIACYPYVALVPEGGVPLDPYPPIRLWMERIEALPGYIDMPGIREEQSNPT